MQSAKSISRLRNLNTAKDPIPLRFITASSLFDGHDASINIIRRLLQSQGAEVIHLAHNRSVFEIVTAAIQEDVDGIAISSYQGGHNEFFRYLIDELALHGFGHIRVFGGGGGVILPKEISALEEYGVEKIYSPDDGRDLGLVGMIQDMLERTDTFGRTANSKPLPSGQLSLPSALSKIDQDRSHTGHFASGENSIDKKPLVLGITGTGGAGKSSFTDEIIRRFRIDYSNELKLAILAIDPSRRRTGGALLGDRVRMNSVYNDNIYMRSVATRGESAAPSILSAMVGTLAEHEFDLVIIETPGVGQGDADIVDLVDTSVYVMTPEFGAQSQLEKIEMLDYANVVVINKFDRRGAEDALRDVSKQMQRNSGDFTVQPKCFGTIASRFNDDGVTAAYQEIRDQLIQLGFPKSESGLSVVDVTASSARASVVPSTRQRYLSEVADCVRAYHAQTEEEASLVRELQHLETAMRLTKGSVESLARLVDDRTRAFPESVLRLFSDWEERSKFYQSESGLCPLGGGRSYPVTLGRRSLSGSWIPKVALPKFSDRGDLYNFLRSENLPGFFPFTAGVFPFKREGEEPARMFAGEGGPHRTNARFKKLSEHSEAKRLSTAFDSVTLYGFDPATRPDIYGKVGTSGVSVATLDDMKSLFDGFDLCDPKTSVSMTINGPAPIILAMFLNAAIDQRVDKFAEQEGRSPSSSEYAELKAYALHHVRGTVQADILKEDQGQNTCIFSTDFGLRMMGDIQQYFIDHAVKHFYSVSISGYHIAEAGANPITQLAFTLANGFTFVEAYLARGMHIDDFAPNLSFFFSNGMDPEYTVIGRVARRIWAITMRDKYGANERSQKLKYHIQTSGRSLHAQEMQFNDIRTTLQALLAINDNCNSLHTNAFDEAVTTPCEESVRRALAIQLIINQEFGVAKTENPNQGAFIVDELTDLVEKAVLEEFDRISERGGVLGAMETGYQRSKIQDESMHYETVKHDGSLPIVGVNTFLSETSESYDELELARASDDEKDEQIERLEKFKNRNKEFSAPMIARLRKDTEQGINTFESLMDAVRVCSLGELTQAFFDVGGQYRRNT